MANVVALVAGVAVAIILTGALVAAIAMVARTVNREDEVTMQREDRALKLRDEASGFVALGVRRLTGVGVRIEGPHG